MPVDEVSYEKLNEGQSTTVFDNCMISNQIIAD
jgi:hypothetical protein